MPALSSSGLILNRLALGKIPYFFFKVKTNKTKQKSTRTLKEEEKGRAGASRGDKMGSPWSLLLGLGWGLGLPSTIMVFRNRVCVMSSGPSILCYSDPGIVSLQCSQSV